MRAIENAIRAEVLSISSASPDLKRETYYNLMIHMPNGTFYINQIKLVDIIRDYNNAYCDYIDVEFSMPLGDFLYDIYKFRDNIELTLTARTIGNKVVERMDGVLHTIDENIKVGVYDHTSKTELNQNMTSLRMQCVNKTINTIRNKVTHGIYKKATVSSVINAIMLKELNIFSSLHGLVSNGMKMVPADNTREYEHIIIEKGTKVLDVPKLLQTGRYGVYNGDITLYLQTYSGTETMFIAPKYRTNLLGFFDTKLYIVATNDGTLRGVDATYAKDNEFLKILVPKSNALFKDENKIKNKGTAIVTTESDSLTSRPVEISKDGMKISEDAVTNRQVHKDIPSGVGPVEYKGATNNQYHARTDALIRDGVIVQVTWNSSNSRLLSPLMPVIYIVEEKGKILRYEGTLQRVDTTTIVPQKTESSMLTLFLQKSDGVATIKDKIRIF